MVGSSQWRCRPTSISRPPSTRASRRNRIWSGRLPRLRRRLGQRMQHVLPGGERRQGAAVERAAGGLDAVARRGVHVVRLLVQAAEQPFAQRGDRLGDAGQRAGEPLRRLRDARAEREDVAFQPRPRRPRPSRRARAPDGGSAAGTPRSDWACRHPGRQVPDGPRRCGRTSPAQAARAPPAARRPAASPAAGGPRPVPRCRRRSPRARDRPPSAPSSQRRISAVSSPESSAENALSAASNTWWPSSNT